MHEMPPCVTPGAMLDLGRQRMKTSSRTDNQPTPTIVHAPSLDAQPQDT